MAFPATGTGAAAIARYMIDQSLLEGRDGEELVIEQGTKMGQQSVLHAKILGTKACDGIEIGGFVMPVIKGEMTFSRIKAHGVTD